MKAILLIRVSTDTQDLVQQREKVVDAAKRDGFTIDDLILIEDKESAVKLSEEERNGLNRLKEYILNDSSITTVYAYEISRISRQAKTVFSIRDFLIKHSIQLIILNPYFKMLKDDGTLSETSNIFFGIFASMAENEGYIRKARTIRGKEKKKALGLHYTGRIPFGYSTNKNKEYIINEETAPLVKKIFEMYTERDMSLRTIVREIQSRGYFKDITFHGCVRNIHEMLHREYYCGTVKGYPQIISEELFRKAQEIKKRNTIETTRTPVKALCKAILFNKETGYMLTVNTSLGTYYSHNGGISVRTNIIEPIVWEYTVKTHKEYFSNDYNEILKQLEHDIEVITNKLRTSQAQIENYYKQIDRLEERVILGKIRTEVADSMEESINKNIHDENINLNNIRNKLAELNRRKEQTLDESKQQYDYDNFDLDEKIQLIHKVIEKVLLTRDEMLHIEIYNKYNSIVDKVTLKRKWRNWVIV